MIRKKGKISFFPKKSYLYDGLKFKSGLEIFAYKSLKAAGIPFEYEKHKFILQESFNNENASFQRKGPSKKNKFMVWKDSCKIQEISYKPDFVGKNWMMETKGMLTEASNLRIKMLKNKLNKMGIKMVFLMPHNQQEVLQCIEIIKNL